MMDQQAKYSLTGLKVEFVGESQTDLSCKKRVLQLVFITPENIIENKVYRRMLLSPIYQENLVALTVDEAHCVKSWGDQFRKSLARIGDLRSLLPKGVNILALTATATKETLGVVIERLSMHNITVVAMPPCQDNIYYKIKSGSDIQDFTDEIVKEFLQRRMNFVYVRSYKDCIIVYQLLKSKMGLNFTEPVGYPNLSGYWLIEMYTRVLPPEKKDEVLHSFSTIKGKLRLVIATTAFGMGVDCQDIARVMHWKHQQQLKSTGRSGRNGEPAIAVMYVNSYKKHITLSMKHYIENVSVCRCKPLFRNFLMYSDSLVTLGCKCCDLCKNLVNV